MRLIPDGVVDREGVTGLASRLGNDTIQDVFALSPTQLRTGSTRRWGQREGRGSPVPSSANPGPLSLRLPFRKPFCPDNLFGHLAATAVPGVEEWRDGAYRRTIRLPHGFAAAALRPTPDHVAVQI